MSESKEIILLNKLKLLNQNSDLILRDYFVTKVMDILEILSKSSLLKDDVSYKGSYHKDSYYRNEPCCKEFRYILELIYNILNNNTFKMSGHFETKVIRYSINVEHISNYSYYPAKYIAEAIMVYMYTKSNIEDSLIESTKYNWIENGVYIRSNIRDLKVSEEIKLYVNLNLNINLKKITATRMKSPEGTSILAYKVRDEGDESSDPVTRSLTGETSILASKSKNEIVESSDLATGSSTGGTSILVSKVKNKSNDSSDLTIESSKLTIESRCCSHDALRLFP